MCHPTGSERHWLHPNLLSGAKTSPGSGVYLLLLDGWSSYLRQIVPMSFVSTCLTGGPFQPTVSEVVEIWLVSQLFLTCFHFHAVHTLKPESCDISMEKSVDSSLLSLSSLSCDASNSTTLSS